MSYGTANTPGVSLQELDYLTASTLSGGISTPLEMASGEAITTHDGAEIRAHGKFGDGADNDRSYTDMVVSAAAATITRMVEASYQKLKKEMYDLTVSILSGDISIPLKMASGEAITTHDGAEIRAHGKFGDGADNDRSYTDMVVSAAAATITRMVEADYIAVR